MFVRRRRSLTRHSSLVAVGRSVDLVSKVQFSHPQSEDSKKSDEDDLILKREVVKNIGSPSTVADGKREVWFGKAIAIVNSVALTSVHIIICSLVLFCFCFTKI